MSIEDSGAGGAVRDCLRELTKGGLGNATAADLAVLRGHVEAYVDELRGRNEQPEHVLIGIKRLMVAAGLDTSPGPAANADNGATADDLRRSVIAWMIERYYTGKPGGQS